MTIESLAELPADPILERRALIQSVGARTLRRRTATSRMMVALCGLALLLALIPLFALVYALITNGLKWWSVAFFTTQPGIPSITQPNDIGGVSNAIVGSLVIDGIAAAVAIPFGIMAGLLIAESSSRFANFLRSMAEIMTGLPSILLGIFAYETIVLGFTLLGFHFPAQGFCALAGSFALAVLMVPIMMKASEASLRDVPVAVREAGLALGARRAVVARRVVIPTALPGLITAVLLAIARAVGETAPLLWCIGASIYNPLTWNPHHETSSLPLQIYLSATSPYPAQRDSAWGVALFLVVVVLVLSLGCRAVAAFIQRERR